MTMRSMLLFGLIVCGCVTPFALGADQGLVPFEALYPLEGRSISYRVPTPFQKAVRNSEEWKALWREIQMHSTLEDTERAEPHEPPRINFARYTLLVVAAGSRSSGGYSVGFHSVREY